MMPLWMTTKRPASSVCGCALASVGWPWVAQRVWPIPTVPGSGSRSRISRNRESLPAALRTSTAPLCATATPAESYPRYSSRLKPSRRMGAAGRSPM
jgi:hypothetical protein